MNLALLLDMAADSFADRIAVSSPDGELTYAELRDIASRAAAWIDEYPVERVAVIGINSYSIPVTLFGSALSGRTFVPLNYRLDNVRLGMLLSDIAPALAIVDDDVVGRVVPDGVQMVTRTDFLAALDSIPSHVKEGALRSGQLDVESVAALLFTSGTTGTPKGAILRHRHLMSYVISTVEFMSAEAHEATLVSAPPYHIASISAILTALYSGRRLVYLPSFEPKAWVETARLEGVTHAMVVPTMLGRILDVLESDGQTLSNLQHLSYGGGSMPLSVIERALRVLPHVDFVNGYGLTETSSTISVLGPRDHRDALANTDPVRRQRLSSVGQPLPSVEVMVVDSGDEPVGPGEWGEILVRGEQISGEYTDAGGPQAGDWFRTRDRGMLDADGYLFLGGRLDDVIVRGGENLSPSEIESVLISHPAVSEAAVVPAPSEEWGEEPVAFVVADSSVDAAQLQEWVSGHLRSARTPTAIYFRPNLPYNETGKLLRRELRAEAIEHRTV
jgi:fatty-acyl-CoA synthase